MRSCAPNTSVDQSELFLTNLSMLSMFSGLRFDR